MFDLESILRGMPKDEVVQMIVEDFPGFEEYLIVKLKEEQKTLTKDNNEKVLPFMRIVPVKDGEKVVGIDFAAFEVLEIEGKKRMVMIESRKKTRLAQALVDAMYEKLNEDAGQ